MTLQECIETIKRLEKQLLLVNVDPTDPLCDRLTEYFAAQNVRVTSIRTASRRPTIAILSSDTGVLAKVDIETLRDFVDHSPVSSGTVGVADGKYEAILGHLKETTFTSYDTKQMLYASRELEDRARRVGRGTIHTGFQRPSNMAAQQAIYTDLARQGLDVHTYAVPDTSPPNLGTTQLHLTNSDEIARTWFVVFDGGGDWSQKSALLAEERDNATFYGAWTYDPGIVDGILEYLETTYLFADKGRPRSET